MVSKKQSGNNVRNAGIKTDSDSWRAKTPPLGRPRNGHELGQEIREWETIRDRFRLVVNQETKVSGERLYSADFGNLGYRFFNTDIKRMHDAYDRVLEKLRKITAFAKERELHFIYATGDEPPHARRDYDAIGTIILDKASYDTLKTFVVERITKLNDRIKDMPPQQRGRQ